MSTAIDLEDVVDAITALDDVVGNGVQLPEPREVEGLAAEIAALAATTGAGRPDAVVAQVAELVREVRRATATA